jgi:hypothetical protein
LIDNDTTAYPDTLLIMWNRKHGEFIKEEMRRANGSVFAQRGPGVLNISGAFIQWSADGKACVLDLRVSNPGDSDLLINAIEFTVLESIHQMPMGQAGYSALYDLDISGLEEFSSTAECQVAQILKPGEADRFGIILSAPTRGLAAGWRLTTAFKTN